MKKLTAVLIVLAMLLTALCACGGEKPDPATSADNGSSATETEESNTSKDTGKTDTTEADDTDDKGETTAKNTEKSEPQAGDTVWNLLKAPIVDYTAEDMNAWDIVEGQWSGTLDGAAFGLGNISKTYLEDGSLELKSLSDYTGNDKDQGIGNYIGVSSYLLPNETYILTLKIKFTSNYNHALHSTYPGTYDHLIMDVVTLGYESLSSGSVSGEPVEILDTEGEFDTYELVFTTGKNIEEDTMIVVGPTGVGSNYYWGAFCPGASYVISECTIQGNFAQEIK